MRANQVFAVDDPSHAGEVRRAVMMLAQHAGLSPEATSDAAIVATEITTNVVKHAGRGEVHLRQCWEQAAPALELVAIDRGPGIADLGKSLRDGYSSAGTAGNGLGAIRRLSGRFDVYTQLGQGTVVAARVQERTGHGETPAAAFDVGVMQKSMHSDEPCGDSWGVRTAEDRFVAIVADGLGHGHFAAQASQAAVEAVLQESSNDPVLLLQAVHKALRSSRGAAVAVASVEAGASQMRFAGLGNISAQVLLPEKAHHMVSHHGTAGHEVRRIQEFVYPWSPEALLVMQSDGVKVNWNAAHYPGLLAHAPSVIAGLVYREAARGRDDACIVAAREWRRGT